MLSLKSRLISCCSSSGRLSFPTYIRVCVYVDLSKQVANVAIPGGLLQLFSARPFLCISSLEMRICIAIEANQNWISIENLRVFCGFSRRA